MKKISSEDKKEIPDFKVTLKPFLGIKPPVYVGLLLMAIVICLGYFLIFHETIRQPGAIITISSNPSGASVYLGDQRVGATPVTFFAKKGPATLSIKKTGFKTISQSITVESGFLAAQWFPHRQEIYLKMELDAFGKLVDSTQQDISTWALASPFDKDFQFPPLFSDFQVSATAGGITSDQIQLQLLKWRRFVGDYQIYRDYAQAWGLWKKEELLPSFEDQWKTWVSVLKTSEDASNFLVFWLLLNQETRLKSEIEKSAFFKEKRESYGVIAQSQTSGTLPGAPKFFGGLTFQGVPSGLFVWHRNLKQKDDFAGAKVSVQSFWMSKTEIPRKIFSDYLRANPGASTGKQDFLKGWKDRLPPVGTENLPVNYVDYGTAQEFSRWFTKEFLGGTGLKAQLPDEIQWEWAAMEAKPGNVKKETVKSLRQLENVNTFEENALGIQGLEGNVMEWVLGSFSPFEPFTRFDGEATLPGPSKEFNVRGGHFGLPNSGYPWDRGGQTGEWCTPFLGFRLVLVRE